MSGQSERTALYRIRGEENVLLYIGITNSVPLRWNGHMRAQPWWDELRSLTVEWYDSREQAEAAEEAAIRAERPKYNKRHNDGCPAKAVRCLAAPAERSSRPARPSCAMRNCMYEKELLALPPLVALDDAGRAFGFGRTRSHELARAGEFPCAVKRFGKSYRVLRLDLLAALGYGPAHLAAPAQHPDAA